MSSPETDITETFITKARSLLADDYLPKIERCLGELTAQQVWWRPGDESNSIGNLLLHLTGNVRQWILSGVGGAPDERVRDREFAERTAIPPAELLAALKKTLTEVDRLLSNLDSASLREQRKIQGYEVTSLEAIFHVVEHFSMHTGQIILLTKMLKGTDLKFYDFSDVMPKAGWRAPAE